MERKTEKFESTIAALDFITALKNNDNIEGQLNCSNNANKTYTWLVSYTPKENSKKKKK